MITLPAWATTNSTVENEVRNLLQQLVANPPSQFIRSPDQWRHDAEAVYSCRGANGAPLARLRKLHNEWLDAEYARLDAVFAVSGVWTGDDLKHVENADALVRRVLAEPVIVDVERLGPGRIAA